MTTHTHRHRVRYRECDRMGLLYHVHFLDHFEAARTELLRDFGLTYKSTEDSGILIQVVEIHIRYHAPAYYDDMLEITTQVASPVRSRLELRNEVRREGDPKKLVSGNTTLCFVDKDRGRPVRAPLAFIEAFG